MELDGSVSAFAELGARLHVPDPLRVLGDLELELVHARLPELAVRGLLDQRPQGLRGVSERVVERVLVIQLRLLAVVAVAGGV